jgi:hypothetical protein
MDQFKRIEKLAWVILFTAFIACLGLAAGTPITARWIILNATRPLKIVLQPRDGIVTLRRPGQETPMVVASDIEVFTRSQIELSGNAVALLLFYHPDDLNAEQPAPPLVTVQIYGATGLAVENARTPRFPASPLPNRVALHIQRGPNTRLTVEDDQRPTEVHVQTPHGVVDMEEGTYVAKVEESQTVFSVSSGRAHVTDPESGEPYLLTDPQSVEIQAEQLGDTYVGERDILRTRNGDFEAPLGSYWEVYTETAYEDETGGQVQSTVLNGRQAVLFTRVGRNHAVTGIRQELKQDIRGAKSLYVRARLLIDLQSLGACGYYGTECPVMIRMEYTDQYGNPGREWLQGFYAIQDEEYQPFCQTCGWKARHIRVAQLGVWYDYESEDLLPVFREQGIEPATIDLIQVYASGHTYRAAVDEVGVLVGE